MTISDLAAQFASPESETYFNTAGSALMPLSVKGEVEQFLDLAWRETAAAYQHYTVTRERLRGNLAALMGAASPAEVAITHNTAEGTSVIANGMDWRAGDVILTLDREYPSTIYAWMNLERRRGVRLVMLRERDGRVAEEEIIDAIRRERPRLFALSAVEWCSGYRFDLEGIGKACEDLGVFFFVDGAQALGFTEVDVRRCRVSAMAGSAWKWLFGPFGLGCLYLRRDLLDSITPVFVGSNSVVNAEEYLDYDFTLLPDMRRFEYSTQDFAGVVWFDAGVRFLRALAVDEAREHVFALQDYAIGRLRELGCEIRGDLPRERRSGIMAFRHPRVASRELSGRLKREAGVFARARDGFVRLSFHLYNTRSGVERLARFLEDAS